MGKRQVKNEIQLKELKIPEEGEMFGRVIKMMGGENVLVKCIDSTTRRGRIRGKLKRRVWIRDNDIVIIAPWGFGDEARGDILWRYTLSQVDWLKQNEKIPIDF
jgi:translation initiation factor 1A